MTHLIDKDALVTEIERLKECNHKICAGDFDFLKESYPEHYYSTEIYNDIISFIDTLEVKDPYEQCIQYPSIKDGIKAHAETYSFNIESKLFPQLTKEQQKLWRKEIEQACISGGDAGYSLAKDPRYNENLEVKEVDLNEEIKSYFKGFGKYPSVGIDDCIDIAKHFFELGLKAQKGEKV